MVVRSHKKKNPPIFSHEFVRSNYGDITCIIFIMLFGGSVFKYTSKYMTPLTRFSYDNSAFISSSKNEGSLLYGNGIWDIAPILAYSLLCTVVSCLVNEYICDKYIPRLQLSIKKAWQLRYIITFSCFHLFSAIISINILKEPVSDQNFSLKGYINSLIKQHPQLYVPLFVKIFYIIAMSFCISMVMNLYYLNAKSKFYLSVILDNSCSFIIYCLMQYYNCGTFGVFFMACYHIPKLFYCLKYMAEHFGGKKSEPILLALSMVHFANGLAGVCVSWLLLFYIIKKVPPIIPFYDRTNITTGLYLCCVLICSFITIKDLKDTFSVLFKSTHFKSRNITPIKQKQTRQQKKSNPPSISDKKTVNAKKRNISKKQPIKNTTR